MVASRSPRQPVLARHEKRHGSTRRSFNLPSIPSVESPRTLCPRDSDAFSFDPSQLAAWRIPQDLWDCLPSNLQSLLTAMQQAGAAVLTGFERLEKHTEELDGRLPVYKLEKYEFLGKLEKSESLDKLDDLPPPKVRTTSTTSSVFCSDISSSVFTGPFDSASEPASLPASQSTSPVSPICLNPSDSELAERPRKYRERLFSTPLEPLDSYYIVELSHLRTEAIPRLRHAIRKVDTEWIEAKRTNTLSNSKINDLENWFAKQKCTAMELDEKCQQLSAASEISSAGLGWTEP